MGCFFLSCFGASGVHDVGFGPDGNDRVLRIEILDQESIFSESCKLLRAKTVDINSTLLASKSTFFHKMFSNGMRESMENQVTLKIPAYEEVAFMDLLDNIKFNTLPKKNELQRLLELLMVADKFEVPSCAKSCINSLSSLPQSRELALLFASLPASLHSSGVMDYIQDFFSKKLKTLDFFPEDIGGIEPSVIEMVLSRTDIPMDSEDIAYEFLMKWVNAHFSDSSGRRAFLHSHVRDLICFPNLSAEKLIEFEQCQLVDKKLATKIKLEYASQAKRKRSPHHTRRLYPLKAAEIRKPDADNDKKCEVVFEIEKEVLKDLERVAVKNSDVIRVGGREFVISFECKANEKAATLHTLGLRLQMRKVPYLTVVDFDVAYAVKRRPDEFERKVHVEKRVFNRRRSSLVVDYFLGNKLDLLLADGSKFFIDGTLLLKVTIRVS